MKAYCIFCKEDKEVIKTEWWDFANRHGTYPIWELICGHRSTPGQNATKALV